jgi:hypothetical protein
MALLLLILLAVSLVHGQTGDYDGGTYFSQSALTGGGTAGLNCPMGGKCLASTSSSTSFQAVRSPVTIFRPQQFFFTT